MNTDSFSALVDSACGSEFKDYGKGVMFKVEKITVAKTASKGIAMGSAFLYYGISEEQLQPEQRKPLLEETEEEIRKFLEAKKIVLQQLENNMKQDEIFAAHYEIANDFTLQEGVETRIRKENQNAEFALWSQIEELIKIFESMEDDYMKERANDVKDVGIRFMKQLKGISDYDFSSFTKPVILVAKDLFPSDTAKMDFRYIKGFLTEEGGITSHVCIMARGMGIPVLVGVENILSKVKENDFLCMDARKGEIVIRPDKQTIQLYEEKKEEFQKEEEKLKKIKELPSITLDGRQVMLCANAGNAKEVELAAEAGADGIGLFRSEFLYMENNHFPTEQEQYVEYERAAKACKRELIIRTLDIGGDKALSYYTFEKEENPFLGFRAIRISLSMQEVFREQLCAILRASVDRQVRIMFPMIISLEELRQAKEILEECKKELKEQGVLFDHKIKVGMMIETPASVLLADSFAKEVDFFSIGTNDLTQYLLAVDRGNKQISSLYNSYHPAVLKAIYSVIQAAHKNHIKVGMCGEFASDKNATKLLLGMELDEFSMSFSEIAEVKQIIRNTNQKEAEELAEKVLQCNTIEEVIQYIK